MESEIQETAHIRYDHPKTAKERYIISRYCQGAVELTVRVLLGFCQRNSSCKFYLYKTIQYW